MILPRYRSDASTFRGAGKGLFLQKDIEAGRIITVPDAIERTCRLDELVAQPEPWHVCARWFENHYTLSPGGSDECYIHHSFNPTGLGHLRFVFALGELPGGTGIAMDNRHLRLPGHEEDFIDTATGQRIAGLPWEGLNKSILVLPDASGSARVRTRLPRIKYLRTSFVGGASRHRRNAELIQSFPWEESLISITHVLARPPDQSTSYH